MSLVIMKGGKVYRDQGQVWSDRNPSSQHQAYFGEGVAPHGTTQRASYTVPTGKKAKVHGAYCETKIITAASTPSTKNCFLAVIDTVPNTFPLLRAILGADKNSVGQLDRFALGQTYTLIAGEKLVIYSADYSTGGTVDYTASAAVTVYDAE